MQVYKKKTEAAKKDYLKALAAYRASVVSKEGNNGPNEAQPGQGHYGNQQQQQQQQQAPQQQPPQQPQQQQQVAPPSFAQYPGSYAPMGQAQAPVTQYTGSMVSVPAPGSPMAKMGHPQQQQQMQMHHHQQQMQQQQPGMMAYHNQQPYMGQAQHQQMMPPPLQVLALIPIILDNLPSYSPNPLNRRS